jgi:hypothetical protein
LWFDDELLLVYHPWGTFIDAGRRREPTFSARDHDA